MQNFRISCQNAIKNARSSGYMVVMYYGKKTATVKFEQHKKLKIYE